ncbi:MAG: glycoside hydrolase family 9 protein [Bacteroidota bacterium]|nr:glycoside hydrolase family 9 protein [Bacteroidota bacterium]
MKALSITITATLVLISFSVSGLGTPVIYINQVGFDAQGPKTAVIGIDNKLSEKVIFNLVDVATHKIQFTGLLQNPQRIDEWMPGKFFYNADFSSFQKKGVYALTVSINGKLYTSYNFQIDENVMAKLTISSIVHYYNKQRANTTEELAADEHMQLYGSSKRVDVHGGWCDASGDVSKYFSHLAYANFMSPQQTPLVTWSLVNTSEAIPRLLNKWKIKDSLDDEALWGADYMMRSLSDSDFFYMIVFSYFNKDPNARRIVGLLANSVTTNQYQCAFREGGGMAIAALARISQWKKHGDYTSQQYLNAAERAFAHLLIYNTKYDDDGKENIIDDYCALMAATELWIATDSSLYRDEARKRAHNLEGRMTVNGWFRSNDAGRPFWHASDAGLPVTSIVRYLKKEANVDERDAAIQTIKKALDYNLTVTHRVSNAFGYARQSFLYKGKVKDGFFIPHDNETGWWWQGENARLSSLATAAIEGGRIAYPAKNNWGTKNSLAEYASQQISWILGCNPYSICFMYQLGQNNVPHMHSNFGHGSERGGISNGITGKEGNADGSGIDFKIEDEGNEWRWTEQWIPHAAWFLQAVTAMAE